MQGKVIACVDTHSPLQSLCDAAVWAAQRLSASVLFLQALERHPEKAPHIDASGQIGLGAQEALLEELAQLDQRRSALAQEQGRQILEGLRARALAEGVTEVERLQRHGELVEALGELNTATSMLVMGRRDHATWGGHAPDHHVERVLRATRAPVLISTGAAFGAPASFVLACDGGDTATRLLGQVAISPLLRELRCQLVHAGSPSTATELGLNRAAERLRQAGFDVAVTLEDGDVDEVIGRAVERVGAGLLVMGANSHSRLRQMVLGSTTTLLFRGSRVPVLVM